MSQDKRKSSKGKASGKAAYIVSVEPAFCNLEDLDKDAAELVLSEAVCVMVHDEEAQNDMQQDAGYTAG